MSLYLFYTPLIRDCYLYWYRVQTCGLGGMKPNTVILGWPYGWRHSPDVKSWRVFLDTVRNASAGKMALLVPKGINFYPESTQKVGSMHYKINDQCFSQGIGFTRV